MTMLYWRYLKIPSQKKPIDITYNYTSFSTNAILKIQSDSSWHQ